MLGHCLLNLETLNWRVFQIVSMGLVLVEMKLMQYLFFSMQMLDAGTYSLHATNRNGSDKVLTSQLLRHGSEKIGYLFLALYKQRRQ